ncbi:MAG: PIN domain-containing protein [Candidatus Aphodosoma sp.]
MKYLFLDTNIFIHFKGFEDIPWKTLLDTDDDVTIVLASIIIREIDGHKDSSKGRVKNKARKISEKLNQILLSGQSSRIPLVYCKESPIKDAERDNFDLSVNDDRFLLNVLHSSFPKEDVYVVSNDTDLLLKAKDLELNILRMDDTYRSSEEPTDEEKELKKVREELARWTDRRSDPKVMFVDTEDTCLRFERIVFKTLDEIVEEKVQKEALRYPEEKDEEITFDNYFNNFQKQMAAICKQINTHDAAQKAVYNQMRKEYLEAFRKKESLETQKKVRQYAFKKIKLRVYNGGTAQTGDLHVSLRFPDGVNLYSPKESMTRVSFDPPVKPQYDRCLAQIASLSSLSALGYRPNNTIDMWDPEKPTDKLEYSTNLSRLTHGLQVEIDEEIYVNTEDSQEFEIEWFIADSNLLDHKYGKLKVVVAEKNNDSDENSFSNK